MKYKTKKTVKTGRGVAVLMLMALMFGAGWMIREYRLRSWFGKERFTVVRTGQNRIVIESFDPITAEALRVTLPAEMEIDTVGGRGKWKVGVLTELADKNGWKWLADSVTDYLGITYSAIDRDMNAWDRWSWWREGKDLRWKEVALAETGMVAEAEAVDQVKVLGLSGHWGVWAKSKFVSSALAELPVGIRIVNTTNVLGLGAHAARVVENSGLKVLMVSSQEDIEKNRCDIYSSDALKDNLGVRFLSRTFQCSWNESGEVADGEIKVVLGEEYREWWLGE